MCRSCNCCRPAGCRYSATHSTTTLTHTRPDSFDWHNAPRRQFIINLDAKVKVTASREGEGSIVLQPGEVFWVDDLDGKGHFSQAVDGEVRHSVFVAVPDDFDVEPYRRDVAPSTRSHCDCHCHKQS